MTESLIENRMNLLSSTSEKSDDFAVYLYSDKTSAASDHFFQMKSGEQASEKVVEMAEKRWPLKRGGKPVVLGLGHGFFLTLRTARRRAMLWTA
jgi:hypothetical protein